MATPVVFNGVNYSIPAFGDVGYAQGPGNLSSYLIAIASGTLQITGGLFSLTADANFGPNFGLVSVYYKTTTANIATAGQFRLAVTDTIQWRNNANTLNLPLAVNGTDQLTFNGAVISTAAIAGFINPGVAGRLTLYPAAGNTVDDVYIQNAQNIDVLIATQAARTVALEYTIPNPGNAVAAATFALLELAQTFTATQTFAAATFTGLITGVSLTLSGILTISSTTNQIVLGTGNTTTITSPAPAASRVYTIPDAGATAQFVMTAGAQTIGGAKTFTANLIVAAVKSGALLLLGAQNDSNTANSDVVVYSNVAGSSGGDAYFQASISGGVTWLFGLDNSDNDNFVISGASTLGTNNRFVINTTTGGVAIAGTNTNDNAAAGFVGQYVSSTVAATNFPATLTVGDLTSISLTAGDWDISLIGETNAGAVTGTQYVVGISTTAGNSLAGLVQGDSQALTTVNPTAVGGVTLVIPAFRASINATTSYFYKYRAIYSAGTPQLAGRISARRVR